MNLQLLYYKYLKDTKKSKWIFLSLIYKQIEIVKKNKDIGKHYTYLPILLLNSIIFEITSLGKL